MPLNFLPIEPPRVGKPNEETYARRQHQFSKIQTGPKKKSIFSRGSSVHRDVYPEPPRVSVDARLPHPSILTCNEPIPLRLLVKKLTDGPDIIFLQMLQVELISYTKILAHDLTRTESGSWVIMSHSNMNIPLGRPDDPIGTDWTIDSNMWNRVPLPNSVAPSFETCNIERYYELEIRVGLTHGDSREMKVYATNNPYIIFWLTITATTYRSSSANASQSIFWNCSSTGPSGCNGCCITAAINLQNETSTQLANRSRKQSTTHATTAKW